MEWIQLNPLRSGNEPLSSEAKGCLVSWQTSLAAADVFKQIPQIGKYVQALWPQRGKTVYQLFWWLISILVILTQSDKHLRVSLSNMWGNAVFYEGRLYETLGFQLLTGQLKTLLQGLGSFCLGFKDKTTDKVTISILQISKNIETTMIRTAQGQQLIKWHQSFSDPNLIKVKKRPALSIKDKMLTSQSSWIAETSILHSPILPSSSVKLVSV